MNSNIIDTFLDIKIFHIYTKLALKEMHGFIAHHPNKILNVLILVLQQFRNTVFE